MNLNLSVTETVAIASAMVLFCINLAQYQWSKRKAKAEIKKLSSEAGAADASKAASTVQTATNALELAGMLVTTLTAFKTDTVAEVRGMINDVKQALIDHAAADERAQQEVKQALTESSVLLAEVSMKVGLDKPNQNVSV